VTGRPDQVRAEPSPLEVRYRRLLRVLPRPYRAAREQEMVDTFLESEFRADPENADITAKYGGVEWRETVSVLALALRLRWADPLGPERYRVRLAALHITLLAVVTMFAAYAVTMLLGQGWSSLWPPAELDGYPAATPLASPALEAWSFAQRWAFVLWLPTLVLLVRGGRRSTWWAAALAAIPAVTSLVSTAGHPFLLASDVTMTAVTVGVPVGLAALAASGTAPSVGHLRAWLVAAGIAMFAVNSVILVGTVAMHQDLPPAWLRALGSVVADDLGLWCFAVVILGGVFAVRRVRRRALRTASLLGLAWFGGAATVLRAGRVIDWSPLLSSAASVYPPPIVLSVTVQSVIVAAITVTAAILAVRRIRQLPPVSYPPPAPPIRQIS
jgi:hypothetical protein